MTQNFSIQRTLQYIGAELRANKRTHIKQAGIVLIVNIGALLLYLILSLGNSRMTLSDFVRYVYPLLFGATMLLISVFIAGSMKKFHQPGSGIMALTIPVGRAEKFIAHTLINILIIPLVMLTLYFGVAFFLWCITGVWADANALFGSRFLHIEDPAFIGTIFSSLVVFSFYHFCAIRFRRSQFGYAVLVLFLLCVAFLIVLLYLDWFASHSLSRIIFESLEYLFTMPLYFLTTSVISATLLYFSWRRFTKLRLKR